MNPTVNPYKLNMAAIRSFMAYHDIKKLGEVASRLCISGAYFSQLCAGDRRLSEEIRLRIQVLTHKTQDQLFEPNPKALPFSHQSLNMLKYYGVKPYDEGSPAEIARHGLTV